MSATEVHMFDWQFHIHNREFKIYDAAGSTTRSEFQLKNER